MLVNKLNKQLYKSFESMLMPKEMIRMGVFGGTYFSKLDKEKRI
jgi:NADH:ubiquinone oxidoreductase subunit B-like Fe-S oxidoreductase